MQIEIRTRPSASFSGDHSYLRHIFPSLNKSLSKVNIHEEGISQAKQQPEALETSNH